MGSDFDSFTRGPAFGMQSSPAYARGGALVYTEAAISCSLFINDSGGNPFWSMGAGQGMGLGLLGDHSASFSVGDACSFGLITEPVVNNVDYNVTTAGWTTVNFAPPPNLGGTPPDPLASVPDTYFDSPPGAFSIGIFSAIVDGAGWTYNGGSFPSGGGFVLFASSQYTAP